MRCLSLILTLILTLLFFISCKENKIKPEVDIYNEWEWVMTTFDTRGEPITSQKTDTTFYYKFTRGGQLEMRDINRTLQHRYTYRIIEEESFNRIVVDDLNMTWGYSIVSDTLEIWHPLSIYPSTQRFRRK